MSVDEKADSWQSSVYQDKQTAMKARNTHIGIFAAGGVFGAAITAVINALRGRGK